MSSSFRIKTNNRGKNILIVRGILFIDNISEIKAEDFDAIFVEDTNQSHYELSYQLENLSPIHSYKCHLKPRFLATTLKNRTLNQVHLIDGFTATIDEKEMCERVDEIYENIELIEKFDISEVKNNNYIYFLKLCKYAITRKMFSFTITMDETYAMGHTSIFASKHDYKTANLKDDFIRFNHTLLELGYAKRKKFLERIHVCPHCMNPNLFYMESCPKCDSSNLKEEPVLHHFRCANISPESSYAYDGELRCPKCHQFLRHIGVDYDRPSNVYTCQECNHTFLHTRMKVYCSSCKKILRPSELLANDLYIYEYTPEGILAISSNDAVIALSKDIWAGYSNFDSFISQIRLFSYSHEKGETIIINRFKAEGDKVNKNSMEQIITELQKRFHYNNLSYKGNYIFMATKATNEKLNEQVTTMKEEHEDILRLIELKYAGITLTEQEYLQRDKDEKLEMFINRISKVYR